MKDREELVVWLFYLISIWKQTKLSQRRTRRATWNNFFILLIFIVFFIEKIVGLVHSKVLIKGWFLYIIVCALDTNSHLWVLSNLQNRSWPVRKTRPTCTAAGKFFDQNLKTTAVYRPISLGNRRRSFVGKGKNSSGIDVKNGSGFA